MIKIVTFFFTFVMAVEYLINIETELWQTSFLSRVLCFVSGISFGHLISYWFLQKDLRWGINQQIDQFFSDLKWVEYLRVNVFLNTRKIIKTWNGLRETLWPILIILSFKNVLSIWKLLWYDESCKFWQN